MTNDLDSKLLGSFPILIILIIIPTRGDNEREEAEHREVAITEGNVSSRAGDEAWIELIELRPVFFEGGVYYGGRMGVSIFHPFFCP